MCSLVIGLVGGRGESVYDVVAGLGHRIGDEVEARTDVCEGLDRCLAKEVRNFDTPTTTTSAPILTPQKNSTSLAGPPAFS